jgi:hypothetical protein
MPFSTIPDRSERPEHFAPIRPNLIATHVVMRGFFARAHAFAFFFMGGRPRGDAAIATAGGPSPKAFRAAFQN